MSVRILSSTANSIRVVCGLSATVQAKMPNSYRWSGPSSHHEKLPKKHHNLQDHKIIYYYCLTNCDLAIRCIPLNSGLLFSPSHMCTTKTRLGHFHKRLEHRLGLVRTLELCVLHRYGEPAISAGN